MFDLPDMTGSTYTVTAEFVQGEVKRKDAAKDAA
jgi:hypothetical protein